MAAKRVVTVALVGFLLVTVGVLIQQGMARGAQPQAEDTTISTTTAARMELSPATSPGTPTAMAPIPTLPETPTVMTPLPTPPLHSPVPASSPGADEATALQAESASATRLVAYYFHGTQRCKTCILIEQYAKGTLTTHFSTELETGMMEFLTIDTDQPANRHYVDDYQLYAQSLVLALYQADTQLKWKNLPDVWRLVGDEKEYDDYVRQEVEAYLSELQP